MCRAERIYYVKRDKSVTLKTEVKINYNFQMNFDSQCSWWYNQPVAPTRAAWQANCTSSQHNPFLTHLLRVGPPGLLLSPPDQGQILGPCSSQPCCSWMILHGQTGQTMVNSCSSCSSHCQWFWKDSLWHEGFAEALECWHSASSVA